VLENGNTGEFSYINEVALNKSNPQGCSEKEKYSILCKI
jgi:hypothetical protein